MTTRTFLAVFLGAALALAAAPRRAAAQSVAEAEQLFRDGMKLMDQGRIAEACEAFDGSQRLDPAPSTLMNLADCREQNRQYATAWSLFVLARNQVRGQARLAGLGEDAGRRALALEPRLSQLVINVPAAGRADGLVVTRNDAAVDPSTWNRSIPIDGGRYVIVASAPGHAPWTIEVTVAAESDRQAVDVPPLAAAPDDQPDPTEARTAPASRMTGRRWLALGLGGGALASLGVALAFELSGRNTLDEYHRAPAGDDRERLYDQANDKHHLAQGLAITGGVLGVAAAYLWFTGRAAPADRATALAPLAAPGAAGVALIGAF